MGGKAALGETEDRYFRINSIYDLAMEQSGGPSGARTLDTRIKSPVLCQLS